MQITVGIEDREVKDALQKLMQRTSNLKPALQEIGEVIRRSVEQNFAAGGRPGWKPSRRAGKGGGQTLSLTGRLRRSFTVQADNDRVAVGTNVIYAAIHQFGGKTPPHVITARNAKALFWAGARHPVKSVKHPGSVIPARPFLMVQDEDWSKIGSVINRYLSMR